MKHALPAFAILLIVGLSACHAHRPGGVVRGAAVGAGLGAVAGAVVGRPGRGAAVGAAAGALVGGTRPRRFRRPYRRWWW
ncbi:MAG: YMGG-like glycine zipper-containing protein [Pseudomonadota bacterium]